MKARARDDPASETDAVARALGEFGASLEGLRPSTKRRYLVGARALLRAAFPGPAGPRDVGSYASLWERVRGLPPPEGARVRPFLRFLGGRAAPQTPEDLDGIRRRVLEALGRANRFPGDISWIARRDAALVAALCAAPDRGDPRQWPQACLTLQGTRLLLWDREVAEPALGAALRHWRHWRERLTRPDQRRLYRKSLAWAQSGLLFPGPHGAPLSRLAPHNALRRAVGVGEGGVGLSPEKIRRAFLARL